MTAEQIVRKFHPQVTVVRDATKNIVVEVTKRDINTMARKKHTECALAIACKRQKDVDGVIVGIKSAYLIQGTTAVRYIIPASAQREIVAFDRSGDFEPGIYHFRKVPESSKLGAAKHGKNRGPHTSKRVDKYYHRTENVRHYEY